jgi:hypothetical protein
MRKSPQARLHFEEAQTPTRESCSPSHHPSPPMITVLKREIILASTVFDFDAAGWLSEFLKRRTNPLTQTRGVFL